MGRPFRSLATTLTLVIASTTLWACHGGTTEPTGGVPTVVASTDVWGSVARAVAGDRAEVISIIVSSTADPHSFRASPSDAAAITDADVLVYNGGGYDQWVDDVLKDHPNVTAVEAYALLDAPAVGERQPANEHVFYELGTAKSVAAKIADELARIDPAHAADYRARADGFGHRADAIEQTERAIRNAQPGAAVVATEPVAHYLLLAAGLTDKTPLNFLDAIEQDTDPAPIDIAAILDLLQNRSVAALVFNDQTVSGATRQVRDAAHNSGIPIVTVTETLPPGTDYLTWQGDTAARLSAALTQGR